MQSKLQTHQEGADNADARWRALIAASALARHDGISGRRHRLCTVIRMTGSNPGPAIISNCCSRRLLERPIRQQFEIGIAPGTSPIGSELGWEVWRSLGKSENSPISTGLPVFCHSNPAIETQWIFLRLANANGLCVRAAAAACHHLSSGRTVALRRQRSHVRIVSGAISVPNWARQNPHRIMLLVGSSPGFLDD